MKNKINNKNKMNKNKMRFFEGYIDFVNFYYFLLEIMYWKKNFLNEWKKIQLYFLSKKLIYFC